LVSFAKEAYKRDDILQKRPIILRSLLIVATPLWVRSVDQICFVHKFVGVIRVIDYSSNLGGGFDELCALAQIRLID